MWTEDADVEWNESKDCTFLYTFTLMEGDNESKSKCL